MVAPIRSRLEYIGDSHFDATMDTLPDNAVPLQVTVEPKLTTTGDHVLRMQNTTSAFLQSGQSISFLDRVSAHKVTDVFDGVIIKADLSEIPLGESALQLTVLAAEYDDLNPVGQIQNWVQLWVFEHAIHGGLWIAFNWQAPLLADADNPYRFNTGLYERGSIERPYDPFSMQYLALLHEGGGYWSFRTSSTRSGLGTVTGDFTSSEYHESFVPPEYNRDMILGQPTITTRPLFMPSFYVDLRPYSGSGTGWIDLEFWEVNGMDVLASFDFPWAVAVDGEWHGTYNLAAGSYYDPDLDQLVFDWSSTYPQRLGS